MDPRKSFELQVRHRKAGQISQKFKKLQNFHAQKLIEFQSSLENIHHTAEIQNQSSNPTSTNLTSSLSHDFIENTPLNTLISDFILELSENRNDIIKNQAFTKYLRRTSRLTQIETHRNSIGVVKTGGCGELVACKRVFEAGCLKSGEVNTNFKDSWRKLATFFCQENAKLKKSSENRGNQEYFENGENRENFKNFKNHGLETTMIPSNKNTQNISVLPSGDFSSHAEQESETLVPDVSVIDSSCALNLENLVQHKVDFRELKFHSKKTDLPDFILVPDGQFFYKPTLKPFSDASNTGASRGALTRCASQDFTSSKADFLQKLKSVAPVQLEQLEPASNFCQSYKNVGNDDLFSSFYEKTMKLFHAHSQSFTVFEQLDCNTDSLASIVHKNLEFVKIELFDQIEAITHQQNGEIRCLLEKLDSLKVQYESSCQLLKDLADFSVRTVELIEGFVFELDELRKPVLGRGERVEFTNKRAGIEDSISKLALTVHKTISEQYNPAVEKINYKENLCKVMFTNGLKLQLERKLQNNLQK